VNLGVAAGQSGGTNFSLSLLALIDKSKPDRLKCLYQNPIWYEFVAPAFRRALWTEAHARLKAGAT
jgi:hypothetical protein